MVLARMRLGRWVGQPIGIKARGTGANRSPQAMHARPATLTGVTVTDCTITGGQRGIRLGEPGGQHRPDERDYQSQQFHRHPD